MGRPSQNAVSAAGVSANGQDQAEDKGQDEEPEDQIIQPVMNTESVELPEEPLILNRDDSTDFRAQLEL